MEKDIPEEKDIPGRGDSQGKGRTLGTHMDCRSHVGKWVEERWMGGETRVAAKPEENLVALENLSRGAGESNGVTTAQYCAPTVCPSHASGRGGESHIVFGGTGDRTKRQP